MSNLTAHATSQPADLERAIGILRRRYRTIGASCLLVALALVGYSLLQQKEYTTSASLLFRDQGFAEDLFGRSVTTPNPDPTREAATNVRLVELSIVAVHASKALHGTPSVQGIEDMVSVSADGLSDVVSVTATSTRPALAAQVANTFARQFIEFRASADKSKLLQAKRLAEGEYSRLSPSLQAGVRGQELSRGAEKLGILASLQTGNAELVQPAKVPTSPSSPKPVRNGLLGAIIGLLFGISVAFLSERLNRRLREPEEVREAFELPVLGAVPVSKALIASNEGPRVADLPFMENEAFRMLRASLRYFNVDHEIRSVLVTSQGAGVGKSTVAWNLGRVATSSSKTIIVETDLREPSISRQHGLSPGPGLAELLTHQVELADAIQTKPVGPELSNTENGNQTLDIIVAGSLPPNPAELIESQTMSEVLSQLTERYELVVIDTAPVGVVADAFPLLSKVDGVIIVARIGETTSDHAARLREQFEQLDVPLLGVVANAVKLRKRGKYGYGYGSYGPYARANGIETAAAASAVRE